MVFWLFISILPNFEVKQGYFLVAKLKILCLNILPCDQNISEFFVLCNCAYFLNKICQRFF